MLGTQAERHFSDDPNVTLIKLRLFGELLAKRAAAKLGIYFDREDRQIDLINRLSDRGAISHEQKRLFHDLRKVGNAAVHEGRGEHGEALHQLKMARQLGIWFQRAFGNNRKFDPGPFVPPPKPRRDSVPPGKVVELEGELDRLRQVLDQQDASLQAAREEADAALRRAEEEAQERKSAEELAEEAEKERLLWEAMAAEQGEAHEAATAKQRADLKNLEEQKARIESELVALQATATAQPKAETEATVQRAKEASEEIDLTEAETRRLIDKQLRDAGWEADTEVLTFDKGVRPQKGRNVAIAEWPTDEDGKKGFADYVLFKGLTPFAVVEAKRKQTDVFGAIVQAKRYSRGYQIHGDEQLPHGPWRKYRVPFLFATNGRPYLRQLETKSGIAFLDVRKPDNHPRALPEWYTPEGLSGLLKQDHDHAHNALRDEPTDYLHLRDYQVAAIKAIEAGLENDQRDVMVAMATGTGKTRTCIGLCYRLLKTKRFRRILFLVDRSALGHQTANALKDMRLENMQTFTDIFDVKELGDIKPEPDTRFQIATIQSMVKRVLFADDEAAEQTPTVDQYDCIVVDECHRGYLLDRELSDHEMTFRNEQDYISKCA